MARDYTFRQVLEARAAGDLSLLNEMSLGRAYQHVQSAKEGGGSFGIVTAYRAGNTAKKNREDFAELQKHLRSKGLGFVKMRGHWRECQDEKIAYKDCPPEKLKDAAEPSLFVPGISQKDLDELGKKYNQDAVVYSGPETKGNVHLRFKDGADPVDIGAFHPQRVAQAYSQLKGCASFTFEYIAQSHAEALIEQAFNANPLSQNIAAARRFTSA